MTTDERIDRTQRLRGKYFDAMRRVDDRRGYSGDQEVIAESYNILSSICYDLICMLESANKLLSEHDAARGRQYDRYIENREVPNDTIQGR